MPPSSRSRSFRHPVSSRPPSLLRRRVQRTGLIVLTAILLVYPLDWALWRVRMAFGVGLGSVQLTETTAATLKGNHFEVYSQQTTAESCSRSLLPQAGAGACWWLRAHPQQVRQY